MTELLSGVAAPSDAELISRVRGGDVAAYGDLFSRHVEAARRLGRQLVRGPDMDDLVSDAFAKTLQALQSGSGPDVAFRAYLLTSVRRLHVDRMRAGSRVQPAEDMTLYDDGEPFHDTAVADFENGAAARAFASLPERWQLVLWHLEVEGQKPADIAPLLGMSANSVSALAYRAREGLRQAFLTMHLADSPTERCRWVNQHLGARVRKGLSRRDTSKVDEHLAECRRCTAMYLELSEINSNLSAIIAPLVLGAAAAGYVASAGGAGLTGVSALVGRVRDTFGGGTASGSTAASAGTSMGTAAATGGAVTAGGVMTVGGLVAAGIAAVTTAALVLGGPAQETLAEADQPVGITRTPTSPPAVDEDPALDGADTEPEGPAALLPTSPGDVVASAPAPEVLLGAATDPLVAAPDAVPVEVPGDVPGEVPVDVPGDAPVDMPGELPGDVPGEAPPATPEDPNPPAQPGTGPGAPSVPPTKPPASPAPVTTLLSVSAADVVDGRLTFRLAGSPVLPASVDIALESPQEVRFATTGPCPLSTDKRTATCTPVPEFTAAGAVGLRAAADATAVISVPLEIPPSMRDGFVLGFRVTSSDRAVATEGASVSLRYLRSTPAPPGQPPVTDPGTDPGTDPAPGGETPPTGGEDTEPTTPGTQDPETEPEPGDPEPPPATDPDAPPPTTDPDDDAPATPAPSVSFGPPVADRPFWEVRFSVKGLPDGATPHVALQGGAHASLREITPACGPGQFVARLHMPPGQGQDIVRLVVTIGSTSYTSDPFAVGERRSGHTPGHHDDDDDHYDDDKGDKGDDG